MTLSHSGHVEEFTNHINNQDPPHQVHSGRTERLIPGVSGHQDYSTKKTIMKMGPPKSRFIGNPPTHPIEHKRSVVRTIEQSRKPGVRTTRQEQGDQSHEEGSTHEWLQTLDVQDPQEEKQGRTYEPRKNLKLGGFSWQWSLKTGFTVCTSFSTQFIS